MSDVTKGHIVHRYDQELGAIRTMVLGMGELVLSQSRKAVQALIDGDINLARRVVDSERKIDYRELDVDDAIFNIIAKRQPAAIDLRLVLALSKVGSYLERTGDKAEQIAWCAIRLLEREGQPASRLLYHLRRLDELSGHLLGRSLEALAEVDVEIALDVFREGKQVDEAYDAATRHLMTFVFEDTAMLGQMLDVSFALRALSSIADHATSVAEQVIFVAKGKDVRYQNREILIEALSQRKGH
jgi:phosphate transport system protein